MKFNLVFLVVVCSQSVFATEIHAWTDKDGRKHYSDKAPVNVNDAESRTATEVLPTRTQESMLKAIELKKGKIFAKYMKTLKINPSLKGKFSVKLLVDSSGAVAQALIMSSELGNSELESELLSELNSINFGKERVKISSINYTIDFLPK